MDTNMIIGLCVGSLQGVIILILRDIKATQDTMWRRLNNHYHEVSCDNDDCNHLKTGNVILPQGSV